MIEIIDQIQDSTLKREYLQKLKDSIKEKSDKTNLLNHEPIYNIKSIIFEKYEKTKPRKITKEELNLEINTIKAEISELKKEQQQIKRQIEFVKNTKIQTNQCSFESETEDQKTQEYMMILIEVSTQRYLIKIKLLINEEFQLETIALVDTSADQNCIRERIIPTKYYDKTIEGLKTANDEKLKITYKISNAEICNQGIKFKTPF
ncbi:Uncharacterized protein TCM_012883 [Theobroma cacao]|uniref:Retropepsins domain-containing protein n=1 Tax=Theobroma cacao TaxID=3641 RepID=A0A061FWB3_THECC|nr:Uncharacterized protein TCM_012883 [Theobroma cacao]